MRANAVDERESKRDDAVWGEDDRAAGAKPRQLLPF